MELEAIYKGVAGSTVRVNNGTTTYQLFKAGEPEIIDTEMAERLKNDPDFVVRAKTADGRIPKKRGRKPKVKSE